MKTSSWSSELRPLSALEIEAIEAMLEGILVALGPERKLSPSHFSFRSWKGLLPISFSIKKGVVEEALASARSGNTDLRFLELRSEEQDDADCDFDVVVTWKNRSKRSWSMTLGDAVNLTMARRYQEGAYAPFRAVVYGLIKASHGPAADFLWRVGNPAFEEQIKLVTHAMSRHLWSVLEKNNPKTMKRVMEACSPPFSEGGLSPEDQYWKKIGSQFIDMTDSYLGEYSNDVDFLRVHVGFLSRMVGKAWTESRTGEEYEEWYERLKGSIVEEVEDEAFRKEFDLGETEQFLASELFSSEEKQSGGELEANGPAN